MSFFSTVQKSLPNVAAEMAAAPVVHFVTTHAVKYLGYVITLKDALTLSGAAAIADLACRYIFRKVSVDEPLHYARYAGPLAGSAVAYGVAFALGCPLAVKATVAMAIINLALSLLIDKAKDAAAASAAARKNDPLTPPVGETV